MKISKNYCAVFFDIDGTLIGSSLKALNSNLNAISKVRALGHKVFINTGRSAGFIPAVMSADYNFDGMVAGAGSYVKLGEKVLLNRCIPYKTLIETAHFILDNNLIGAFEGVTSTISFGRMELYDGVIYNEHSLIVATKENVSELLPPDIEINKFTINGIAPKELISLLSDNFDVIQHIDYAEFILKGTGKALGMETILSEIGLSRSQSIAVGDSLNDLDMIEYAGLGVAMGNAVDQIKAAANFTTKGVNEAGAAEALQKIFEF